VDEDLDVLKRALGIEAWEIGLSYAPEAADAEGSLLRGDCTRLVDYQSAHISLNPEAFESDADVARTLRHELCHVVLAPFDLYTSAVERLELADDAREVLERLKDHVLERAVAALERMLDARAEASA
jgi:hypothetical protein